MGEMVLFLGWIVIIAAIAADQASKLAVDFLITENHVYAITSWFNLVKVWNTGVSFSMFNNHGNIGRWVLIVLAVAVSLCLIYLMCKESNRVKQVAYSLIIGGAIGNVIDRIRYGAVLDFLDFHYKTYHWPAFNLADTVICVGAGLFILMEILNGKKKGKKKS